MVEINVTASSIVPEVPKVLANEQINVYVPNATDKQPGVASFNKEYFEVKTGGNVVIADALKEKIDYSRLSIYDETGKYENPHLKTDSKTLIPAVNELKEHLDDLTFDEQTRVEAEIAREKNEIERQALYDIMKGIILPTNRHADIRVDQDGNGSIYYIGMSVTDNDEGDVIISLEDDQNTFGTLTFVDDNKGNVIMEVI